MTLTAGVRPLGCSKSTVRYDLILNIRKTSSLVLDNDGYLIDNIRCKYEN